MAAESGGPDRARPGIRAGGHLLHPFEGKVAVVTGAGAGIGRELARLLALRGAHLAISDVDAAGLEETRELCSGAEVRHYLVDVSSREQVFAHADAVKRDFGTAHYIFNNAGVSLAASFEHSTIEEIEWLLDINLWGVIYGTKAFLPLFLAQREGHIVNMSSIFGLVGVPGQSAYNISKFGVRGLTESLWRELRGTGVNATTVHPGGIRTNIEHSSPLGRFADDYEKKIVASSARFFVTPADDCARAILDGVARGRRRIVTGKKAWIADVVARLLPSEYVRMFGYYGL
jgi:NAD(P)-dependent dehydrogenase (short-subunit alcohol dehydrogenase family)